MFGVREGQDEDNQVKLWTVMCENWTNWATLTVWDWLFLVALTGGWLCFQYKFRHRIKR